MHFCLQKNPETLDILLNRNLKLLTGTSPVLGLKVMIELFLSLYVHLRYWTNVSEHCGGLYYTQIMKNTKQVFGQDPRSLYLRIYTEDIKYRRFLIILNNTIILKILIQKVQKLSTGSLS